MGRPIALTSAMLSPGFPVVALSEFGALSAVAMAICLATDLILLPAIPVRLGL